MLANTPAISGAHFSKQMRNQTAKFIYDAFDLCGRFYSILCARIFVSFHGFRFIAGEIRFLKYLPRCDEIREKSRNWSENIANREFVAIYYAMSGNQEFYKRNAKFIFLRSSAKKCFVNLKLFTINLSLNEA